MILMIHKVDLTTPSQWWITPDVLEERLDALAGHNFVYLCDYDPDNPKHVCITFDDGYANVTTHALPLLASRGLPFEVFIIGDYVGLWNEFDRSEPPARLASWQELQTMVKHGGRVQWHTRSHRNLLTLSCEEQLVQLSVPEAIREEFPPPHFQWFSYPYGLHDSTSIALAEKLFDGAVAVMPTAGRPGSDRHALARQPVHMPD